MDKPVFLHWAHKELWDALVQKPKLRKNAVLIKLDKKFPGRNFLHVDSECFACQAVEDLLKIRRVEIRCHNCPLDWGEDVTCLPLIRKWWFAKQTRDWEGARQYAVKIRDVPLIQSIHDLYTVKESPDE